MSEVNYLSHADIKPNAESKRIRTLADNLKSNGCVVHLRHSEQRIYFEVPESELTWVKTGGLATLIDSFSDYATTVTKYDCWMRNCTAPPGFWLPMRIASGIRKPRKPILGTELAGEI